MIWAFNLLQRPCGSVFLFLAARVILPDTLADYFSLLKGMPRNPCYGTADLVTTGRPKYFLICFRVQEQLGKEISCSAAITSLKWPLNFTALLSAKPNRSSTLRYLMSMFLVCLKVLFLQCNMLKSQVSNVRKTKRRWVTNASVLLTEYL